MEMRLKCVLLLPLKEMALRKVATLLMTDSEIVASISKFQIPGYHTIESIKEWRDIIEGKIKGKMLKFEVSESLQKQIIDIVKPIGLQIRRWKECQEKYLSLENQKISLLDSSKLFWTSEGTIDYRKTAEVLIRRDDLDVAQRYILACANCLEEDIPHLWEKLPEEDKLYFYDEVRYRHPSPPLPFCWPHIVTGDLSALDYLLRGWDGHFSSFHQWAFEISAHNGNRVAVEYFIQKLTCDEREASLTRTVVALLTNEIENPSCFRHEKLSDVSCYLLAAMSPAQQMEVFRKHPGRVLLRFLDCPWPDLFLENVGLMWGFLNSNLCDDFLRNMASRFTLSDHYFPKLFREFFVQSPPGCKQRFVDGNYRSETPASQFLSTFFKLEDSKSVEVIFRNLRPYDRMRLVCSRDVLRVFYFYMLGGWSMVEVCVREATQCEEDRLILKRAFMKYHLFGGVEWENRHFKRFFDFLDEAVASGDGERRAPCRIPISFEWRMQVSNAEQVDECRDYINMLNNNKYAPTHTIWDRSNIT